MHADEPRLGRTVLPGAARPFDIVVFDEASQIRVADAIGAMGRSRSVVVVGDSKQMPPTSFAEANATSMTTRDSDQELFIDKESILTECVGALVPQQWLSWHYRSQDEALIAFSNQHYYNGRLASFPAPHADKASVWRTGDLADPCQRHLRARRKGQNTAHQPRRGRRDCRGDHDAVPNITGRRPSMGVITFNAQQRDLIENLLRDSGDERVRPRPR